MNPENNNQTPIFAKKSKTTPPLSSPEISEPTNTTPPENPENPEAPTPQTSPTTQEPPQAPEPPNTTPSSEALDIIEQIENPDGSTTTHISEITTTDTSADPTIPANQSNPIVPSQTTPTTSQPSPATPSVLSTPPKKKKTGLIVGCIAGAVAITAGIAGAVAFSIYYNSPEVVAADAIVNLFQGEPISVTGDFTINLGSAGAYYYDLESLKLEFSENLDSPLPASTQVTLVATADSAEYRLTLGNAISQDGVLYLKIDNLRGTIDQLLKDHSTDIPASTERTIKAFSDIINAADGQWYKIDIPNLLEEYRTYIDLNKSEVNTYKDLYACTINTINTLPDRTKSLADTYRQHPFLIAEDYTGKATAQHGGHLYTFNINAQDAVDFTKEAINNQFLDDIASCADSSGIYSGTSWQESLDDYRIDTAKRLSGIDTEELQSDIKSYLDDLPEYYIEIDGSHHIVGYYMTYAEGDASATAHMNITYGKSSAEIPSDTKPINTLIDDILELLDTSAAS